MARKTPDKPKKTTAAGDAEGVKRDEFGRLQPGGVTINPKGRPRSSRHKLSEKFLAELARHFEAHGAAAIEQVYDSSPVDYLRLVVGCLPKKLETEGANGEAVGVAIITADAIQAIVERGRSDV